MKRILVLMSALFMLLGMFASPVLAKEIIVWEPINEGLDGGIIKALAIDPLNPAILFAGTPVGIFKTTNRGMDWQAINTGIEVYDISAIAIDPLNPKNVYASSFGGGVYKASNGGETWFTSNAGLGEMDVHSIAIKPDEPTVLLAGTAEALYRSTNSGQSWLLVQEAPQSATPDVFGSAIAFAPGNSQIVYVGTYGFGVWKSLDSGLTWQNIYKNHNSAIIEIAVSPQNDGIVFMATENSLFKSVDGGSSWQSSFAVFCDAVSIDPQNSNTVYLGYPYGVMKSEDGGESWAPRALPYQSPISVIAIDPKESDKVFVGSQGAGVIASANGGSTWSYANKGLHAQVINAIAFDSQNPEILYAGSDQSGVFKSLNKGKTWIQTNQGLENLSISALMVDPQNASIVFAATKTGHIYKSADKGITWVKRFALSGFTTPVNALAIDPTNSSTLFAASGGEGLFKSLDGGETWANVEDFWETYRLLDIQYHPTQSGVIFIAADDGVYKSLDNGETWDGVSSVQQNSYTYAIRFDVSDPNTIYTATRAHGILKSSDGGGTWQEANEGLPNKHVITIGLDSVNQRVYATVRNSGVYVSEDRGAHWQKSDKGLKGLDALTIVPNQTVAGSMLVGTEGGGIYQLAFYTLDQSLYLPMLMK